MANDLVSIGFKAETQGLTKAQQELMKTAKAGEKVDTSLGKAEKQLKATNKAAKETSGAMGGLGRKAGMAGVQFEQFFGQVGSGTPFLRALGYQATDLGIVLGAPLLGSIVGISAAIAGPLVSSLFTATTSTEDLIEQIGELRKEFGLTAAQSRVLIDQQNDIIKASDDVTKKVKEQRDALQERININNFDRVIKKRKEMGIQVVDVTKRQKDLNEQLNEYNAILDTEAQKVEKARNKIAMYNESVGAGDSETRDFTEKTRSLTLSLESQIIALRDGESAALEYNIQQSLGLETAQQIPQAIRDQITELNRLTDAKKEQAQMELDLQALIRGEEKENAASNKLDMDIERAIDGVDNFGGAWSRTGNIIVDSMGSIVDALDDYEKRMGSISKQQETLNDLRKDAIKQGKDTTKIDAASAKLAGQSLKAQIGYYGDLSGAAGDFFGEQTAARKAFHAVEMALSAVEIGMSLKKTAINVAEGASKIFSQLGWLGFAAVGAMVGVMSGLGFSGGGSGGTMSLSGSVKGDSSATSESLGNASELLSVQVDQLAELRGIRDALSPIQQQATGIAGQLAEQMAQALDESNSFSDLLSTLDKYSSFNLSPFGAGIQGSILSGISGSASSLGLGAVGPYQFGSANVNLFDAKTLDQGVELIGKAFSKQADKAVEDLLPAIIRFQEIGEGAFETLTRLAVEQATFNDSLDYMGSSLSDLDAIMRIEVAQSVFDLVGGFEAFTEASETFFEEFLSDSEQFEIKTKSLGEALAGTGANLEMNRDAFKDYLIGLDRADESQRKQYASLLELLPALDDYYDTLEGREEEARDLRLSALEDEKSMLESIVGKFLPSAQAAAISAQQALEAARRGDFTLANKLSVSPISTSGFGSSSEFELAQARQAASLAEIGRLANDQLTEVDMQLSLAEQQVTILEEINANIIAQGQVGAESSQATQTAKVAETNDKIAVIQEEMSHMQRAMTENMASMNSYIKQMQQDGITVRTDSGEPLKVENA